MTNIIVVTLYKFATLADCQELKIRLFDFCVAQELKGTLLLAPEGINGTVAGTRAGVDALLSLLHTDPRFVNLEQKESVAPTMPFGKMKVRLKKEIVTLGVPGVNPQTQVGTYVAPEDWNALLSDTEILLIDTRNDYEHQLGTFRGAANPQMATFREFPDYVNTHLDPVQHKKVALFCTGGIRCEKATSFMLSQGFETVYHLHGGILKYLEKIPAENSLWQGECFVFDARLALGQGLQMGQPNDKQSN